MLYGEKNIFKILIRFRLTVLKVSNNAKLGRIYTTVYYIYRDKTIVAPPTSLRKTYVYV